jgi:hypothetical protein
MFRDKPTTRRVRARVFTPLLGPKVANNWPVVTYETRLGT